MMKKAWIYLLVAALTACQSQEQTVQNNNYMPPVPTLNSDVMTPEVLWSFGRLGEPAVSPDGKKVAYTVTWFNIAENKNRIVFLNGIIPISNHSRVHFIYC